MLICLTSSPCIEHRPCTEHPAHIIDASAASVAHLNIVTTVAGTRSECSFQIDFIVNLVSNSITPKRHSVPWMTFKSPRQVQRSLQRTDELWDACA